MVTFDAALQHNHYGDVPLNVLANYPDLSLPIFVEERLITIRSEPGAEIWEQGHVMGAHMASKTDLWDIRFQDLGRTNKSIPTGVQEAFTTEPMTARSNIKGRYGGPHLHFVGHKGQKAWVDQVRDCIVQSGA